MHPRKVHTLILLAALCLLTTALPGCVVKKQQDPAAIAKQQEQFNKKLAEKAAARKAKAEARRADMLYDALAAEQIYVDILADVHVGGGPFNFAAGMPASSIMAAVKPFLGVRYKWGGTTLRGLDCSGFTMQVFRRFGLRLPHHSAAQAKMGVPVAKNNLRTGDLVFFATKKGQGINHVGVIVGPDLMAHCSGKRGRCAIESFSRAYPTSFAGARRMLFKKKAKK